MIHIYHHLVIQYLHGLATEMPAKFEKENFGTVLAKAAKYDHPVHIDLSPEALMHYMEVISPIQENWAKGVYDGSVVILGGVDLIAQHKKITMPRISNLLAAMKQQYELKTSNHAKN